jgi:DNA-binding MarR family transcriptional regulator
MEMINESELFGTTTRTSTLLVIQMLGETHGAEIARILGRSPSRIKAAVDSLERAGVIVGTEEGKTRRIALNPRYVASEELRNLLAKLGMMDVDLQKRLATIRRRPRRAGKQI